MIMMQQLKVDDRTKINVRSGVIGHAPLSASHVICTQQRDRLQGYKATSPVPRKWALGVRSESVNA